MSAAFATPSNQLSVTGGANSPTVFDLAALQARPAITQTVNFLSGTTPQTHTYTGASLWGVLDAAGIVNNPNIKNDVLNKYVLATGSDGYQTVYSLGELNPNFGNRPDLVAYAATINGVLSPLTTDGFARTTAPGEVKCGRYVSNLANLDVRSSDSTQAGTGGGTSTQFSVTGAVMSSMSFDLDALKGLTTLTQTFGGHTYTGVSFVGDQSGWLPNAVLSSPSETNSCSHRCRSRRRTGCLKHAEPSGRRWRGIALRLGAAAPTAIKPASIKA